MSSTPHRFLVAVLLAGIAVMALLPQHRVAAAPAERLYVFGGGRVQVLDALTLAPLRPVSGAASRLRGLPATTQLVSSSDGSKLGIIDGNGRAGSRATLSIINVRSNRVTQRHATHGLRLLGVSNDGESWYGEEDLAAGRIVRFVSFARGVLHTLDFHLPQVCCLLLQYDPRRDRLYAMPLATTWGRNPPSPVLSVWQVASRHRLQSMRTPLELIAGTWIIGGSPGTASPPSMFRTLPGFGLSPDGHTLAILDIDDNRLDTVDALHLHMRGNPFIRGSTYEQTSGLAPVVSPLLAGISNGVATTAQFSPDGRMIYQQGTANIELKHGGVTSQSLLVSAIDVAHLAVRGVIAHPLLAPLALSASGRWVYTVIASSQGGKRVDMVQRRTATTLSVVAQRPIATVARQYTVLAVH